MPKSDDSDVICGDVFDKFDVSVTITHPPPTPVTQPESCTCTCGKSKGVDKNTRPEKSDTSFYVKKQTRFNCGTAGHIARNCPNRAFLPFHALRGENESRGRSLIRKISRSRSHDDDWNVNKNRKQAEHEKNKHVLHENTTGTFTKPNVAKPRSGSLKSSSGSSANIRRKSKQSKQKKNVSKLPVNVYKPKYQWVPKNLNVHSSKSYVCASGNKSISTSVKEICVAKKGKPSVLMTWVPKTN